MMKKIFVLILIALFCNGYFYPLYAYSQATAYLCELGIQFLRQGKYDAALEEFRKALLVEPNYTPAIKYIKMIKQMKGVSVQNEIVAPSQYDKQDTLELVELQREMFRERRMEMPEELLPEEIPQLAPQEKNVSSAKKISEPLVLYLDESLSTVRQPIEIEQGKSVVIVGRNIKRFLVTQPTLIIAERINSDELALTGNDVGHTYVHVWDDNGRWTTEWLGVLAKPEGQTYEEYMRQEEALYGTFKIRYNIDWSTYESGRGLNSLRRDSYLWSHGLSLMGPTPYGDFDSVATVRKDRTSTDLTYFTLGLTNGQLGPLKGWNLRAFDYSPTFSNLALPGANLRGGIIDSPAFDNKLHYTGFWGREGGGRYGNLSPGLMKTRNSFLDGFNVNFKPTKGQDYGATLVHGWGRDRENMLNEYDYDLTGNWFLDELNLGYEVANDTEKFAHLFNARYRLPDFDISAELRNIDKSFNSIIGRGWRQGELGALFNMNYRLFDKFNINSNLDMYQDRLFPAGDNDNRWNEDFSWNAFYPIDQDTSMNLDYLLQNDLGKASMYRYQSSSIGITRRWPFLKNLSTYMTYYYQNNDNFSSAASSYVNNRLNAGLRFNVIGELYYYLNREVNWLHESFEDNNSMPNAYETGLDWSNQIANSPFWGSMRFSYRNEDETGSNLSFLSGENYIEGSAELSFRPTPDNEIYGNWRARNIWAADNPRVIKRFETSFNAGMRYLWDTGLRWDAVGNVEGYIFRDLNSDGLRQRDDPPVEGVKVWLGKEKFQVTDIFGYYCFKGVKAKTVFVTIDSSTMPSGFVLTVPLRQEVGIMNNRSSRVDYGMISRSGIRGLVFEDIDGNGDFGKGDLSVSGVAVTLDNQKKALSDSQGNYSFSNASTGEHTISVDLKSIPVHFLPQVALTKKITLFEGVTYIYNLPLKRIKK